MTLVLYSETDGVATVTLNRPHRKNAFDGPMMDALRERVQSLEERTDLLAVQLTGSGSDSFCAGGDLTWLQRLDGPEKGMAMGRQMQETLDRLSRLPMPVIAVLNGYAIGGGAELALACDLRVMEAHSFLQFKQVRVGLITGWGGGPRLVRHLGYGRAAEVLMTCPKIYAERASSLGLCTVLAESGRGLEVSRTLVDRFRGASPMALKAVKSLLHGCDGTDQKTGMAIENNIFGMVWDGVDHREAQAAFAEKRPPQFGGHRTLDSGE